MESAYFNNFLLEHAPRRYHWKKSRIADFESGNGLAAHRRVIVLGER